MATDKKSVFETLSAIDCSKYVEKKKATNGDQLSYLSWARAWQIVKKHFPDATYSRAYWDGKPYLYDENLGYYVETEVTIDGETQSMHLFVMNGANKAMKTQPYSYKTRSGEKWVEAATMFDINTTLQRCLVKNLAMFGLGLNLYYGEDIPEAVKEEEQANQLAQAIAEVKACKTSEEVVALWRKYEQLNDNEEFRAVVAQIGSALKTQGNEAIK